MAGMFDDLLADAPKSSGLFDDLLSDENPPATKETSIIDSIGNGMNSIRDFMTGIDEDRKAAVAKAAIDKEVSRLKEINPGASEQSLRGAATAAYNPNTKKAPAPTSASEDIDIRTAELKRQGYADENAVGKARFDVGFNEKQAKKAADERGNRVGISAYGEQNSQAFMDAARQGAIREQELQRVRDYANENPMTGGLGSGLIGFASGVAHMPQAAVNLPLELTDKVLGTDTPKLPRWGFAKEAQELAAANSPDVANKELGQAWKDGDFGAMVATNLAQSAPSSAMSMAAMFFPPLRAALLPAMGGTTAGQSYAEGDSAIGSALKGGMEVLGESASLGAFDGIRAAANKLPLPQKTALAAIVARKIAQAGGEVTATAASNFVEEAVTQLGQNAVDKYVEHKNVALTDGAMKAGVIGAAAGAAHASPVIAQRAMQPGSVQAVAERALAEQLDSTPAGGVDADVASALRTGAESSNRIRPESTVVSFSDPNSPASQAGITPVVVPVAPSNTAPSPVVAPISHQTGAEATTVLPGSIDPIRHTPDSELLSRIPEDTGVSNDITQPTAPTGDAGAEVRNANGVGSAGEAGGGGQSPTVAGGLPGVADTAGRAVSQAVQPVVGDAASARAIAQKNNDHWHGVDPDTHPKVTFSDPSPEADAQIQTAMRQAKELFGVSADVVAFSDPSPESINGMQLGNKVYINTKGLTSNALNTGWHETHHVMQSIAEADDSAGKKDTPAQRYISKVDAIYDTMGEKGKLHYISDFLASDRIEAAPAVKAYIDSIKTGSGQPMQRQYWTAPQKAKLNELKLAEAKKYLARKETRKEMMADFVGNRATDRGFIRSLAKADPKNFQQWAKKWLQTIHDLIADLRGNGKSKNSKAVDRYVADLNKAKMVLRDAMVELRNSGVISKDANLDAEPDYGRKGVIGEVAPFPSEKDDKAIAKMDDAQLSQNKERAALESNFDAMDAGEKSNATRDVYRKQVDRVMADMGISGWDVEFSSGTFEGKENPNFIITAPDSATSEQIAELANAIGYVLDQKAMITFDESNTSDGYLASFVKITLPKDTSPATVKSLRKWVAENAPIAGGDTLRDGTLVYGNFSGVSDQEFKSQIDAAVESFEDDGEFVVSNVLQWQSGYIEPSSREAYLEGTRYGESNSGQVASGGDSVRSAARDNRTWIEGVGRDAIARRQNWIDNSTSGRERIERDRKLAAEDRARADSKRSGAVEYGQAGPNAVTAVGHHFSKEPRRSLSSAFYGSGLKGLEAKRLEGQRDLQQRIYFYVDSGKGVTPEAGVGGAKHIVKLNNLYDTKADPLQIIKNTKGENSLDRMNNWERTIMRAGFDGYVADTGANQNFAVLIGKHDIPMYSRRFVSVDEFDSEPNDYDRMNELGSFNVDSNDAANDLAFPDLSGAEKKLDKQAELQAELDREFRQRMVDKAKLKAGPAAVTLEKMQEGGLNPESAFSVGNMTEHDGSMQFDRAAGYPEAGDMYEVSEYPGGWRVGTEHSFTMGNYWTKDGAIRQFRNIVAAPFIHKAGFDIASHYRKGTALKLAQTWRNLAGKQGTFKLPARSKSLDFAEVAKEIGALSGYNIDVQGKNRKNITFTDKSSGAEFDASISMLNDKTFKCCTIGLDRSKIGSEFYAVTSEWARNNGYAFESDETLSAVNGFRRTEQATSYALKTGDSGVILPGVQNRVYGYNENPQTKEDHDMNIARLLIAGMRNAIEVDPDIRRLRYAPDTGKFTDSRGNDAEATVKAFLSSKDARASGMGRSTLARAVLTGQIIAGDFDAGAVEKFAEPVAYSRKAGVDSALSEAYGSDPSTDGAKTEFSPQFKKWFKDSKVVNKNGLPLVVYHGTKAPPTQFEKSRTGMASTFLGDYEVERHGIFAAEDPELADEYANQGERPTNQAVMPLFMSIQSPLDAVDGYYTDEVWANISSASKRMGGENPYATARFIGDLWSRGALWKLFDADENNDPAWNVAMLKEAGYDGMRIYERSEGDVGNTAAWVAFDPTQIKSVFNNGDFDSSNPDIRYSRKQLDDYLDGRTKGLALASPQSVLNADIENATKAFEIAIAEIRAGNRDMLPIPVGRIPHALTMLRVQPQMMRVDTSILYKAFVNEDKHAATMTDIKPGDLVRAIYQPALILKSERAGEFEIITSLTTKGGPIIVPVMVNANGAGKGAAIMSMYEKNVSGGGRSIVNRIKEGVVLYADPEQAQVALTGRGAVPLVGINAGRTGTHATPPTKGQDSNVTDKADAVKPLNPNYVGWDRVRGVILDGIAQKTIKTDADLMKWIGNQYKPSSSKDGWADAPAFSRKQPIQRAPGLKDESWFSEKRRQLQDQFIQIRNLQEMLIGRGGVVGEAQDVYRAEERMHGRAQQLLVDFGRNQIEPFIAKAAKMKIGLDEIALYAYAQHAKERNAYIKTINPNIGDAGSGMSDMHADNIIQMVQLAGDAAKFDELHQDLMGITSTTRRVLLDEGLITQDEYDGWENLYENYVPLRGFEDVNHEAGTPLRGAGRGFSMTGKESVKALGRTSKAGDILENIIRDYERAVIRSEKNAVAKTFLDLATSNPDPDLWEIQPVKVNRSFSKASGMVSIANTPDTGDETIAIKVGGQQIRVKINDPLILRAMKLASKDETSQLERLLATTLGTYTNLMRNTLTRFNPIFGAINAVRDSQMGLFSAYDVLGKDGAKLYAKYLGPAMAASFRQERGKADPANRVMDKWVMEMRFAGGTTGGYHMRETSEITEAMRTMMLQAGASPNGKMEWVKSRSAYKGAQSAMKWLEIIGSTSEDAARAAAYRAAREMGKTPAEAASISKNLTTNFNRKGEWGPTLNSLYLFFNAGAQGTTRVLQGLKNPKVQKMMAGVSAAAMALALMNAGFGDDDDGENYWDKIPDFEKERNLIFMLPPGVEMDGAERIGTQGRYVKIPMPYGLNVFAVFGNQMADLARHMKDPSRGVKPAKAAINMTSAIFGSINPFGGGIDPTKPIEVGLAMSPTAADLAIQLMTGSNAFGRPVGPEKSPFDDKPDSENFSARQAGGVSQRVAHWLNGVTGGNEGRAGKIDVMPGTLDNAVRNATGGLGVFIADTFINLPIKALFSPVETTNRDVPLLRNFYGQIDGVTDIGLFYDRRAEVTKELKAAEAEMKKGIAVDYSPESIMMQSLGKAAESYTKFMSDLRKYEIQVAADEEMPSAEKKKIRHEIEKQRAELARSFNTGYIEQKKELAK